MIYIRDNVKQKLKFSAVLFAIVIAIAVAGFMVLRYQVEGEKKVPFQIGKIIVISSARTDAIVNDNKAEESSANNNEGNAEANPEQTANEEQQNATEQEAPANQENYIWNETVTQTNDVYIYIDKNQDYKKEQTIKNIKIENIKILENVKIGKIQVYMPNSLDDGLYKYVNDYLVSTSLTYTGAAADNKKALEINNQGGCIYISFANMGLENYKSNEEQELPQGGSILEKINLSNEDLKFKVSFDLVIEVEDKTYQTNVTLDMPIDGIVGQQETHQTITDFDKTVYKRLK